MNVIKALYQVYSWKRTKQSWNYSRECLKSITTKNENDFTDTSTEVILHEFLHSCSHAYKKHWVVPGCSYDVLIGTLPQFMELLSLNYAKRNGAMTVFWLSPHRYRKMEPGCSSVSVTSLTCKQCCRMLNKNFLVSQYMVIIKYMVHLNL